MARQACACGGYPLAALAARALVAGRAGRARRARVAALAARALRSFNNAPVTTRPHSAHYRNTTSTRLSDTSYIHIINNTKVAFLLYKCTQWKSPLAQVYLLQSDSIRYVFFLSKHLLHLLTKSNSTYTSQKLSINSNCTISLSLCATKYE